MRVFEDSRPEMRDNPKRFRVEILFSPGATSTPLHLDEANRESDLSRLDTAPLQMIGKDNLHVRIALSISKWVDFTNRVFRNTKSNTSEV